MWAKEKVRIIGVVIKDHEKYKGHVLINPFIASSLNYLSDEIEKCGYIMLVRKVKGIMEAVEFASMWNMDGMVLLSFCADEYQTFREQSRIPFVVYDGYLENEGTICNLQIDDRGGGRQVGAYLQSLGHQNVLCIANNQECMDLRRYEGFCEGVGFQADFWQIPIQKKVRDLFCQEHLGQLRRYSAVFAVSDYYAVELMCFLQKSGVRLPEEVSIVGFGDSDICKQVCPFLTSVRLDGAYQAKTAIQMLKRMRQEPDFFGVFQIPVQLIPRESTRRLCD